jgi:hypothetical protein
LLLCLLSLNYFFLAGLLEIFKRNTYRGSKILNG